MFLSLYQKDYRCDQKDCVTADRGYRQKYLAKYIRYLLQRYRSCVIGGYVFDWIFAVQPWELWEEQNKRHDHNYKHKEHKKLGICADVLKGDEQGLCKDSKQIIGYVKNCRADHRIGGIKNYRKNYACEKVNGGFCKAEIEKWEEKGGYTNCAKRSASFKLRAKNSSENKFFNSWNNYC